MGGYLQVLFVQGLEKTMLELAADDILGRQLQDAHHGRSGGRLCQIGIGPVDGRRGTFPVLHTK
ncbi:hypothetical protein GCM10023172_01490 [Hymenobacter ginsengisoli]|uniref:Uncharacterized protein n=2 Tax=Hymenobacteraceae TaxID=1853232 RepID=A0ABP8PXE1_9BACT